MEQKLHPFILLTSPCTSPDSLLRVVHGRNEARSGPEETFECYK